MWLRSFASLLILLTLFGGQIKAFGDENSKKTKPSVTAERAPDRNGVTVVRSVSTSASTPQERLDEVCEPFFPKPFATLAANEIALCPSNPKTPKLCRTTVTVEKTDLQQTGYACKATWKNDKYYVFAGERNVVLRWDLENKDVQDKTKYKFDSAVGIGLCKQSKNDEDQDLTNGKCWDSDCRSFRWLSLNARPRHLVRGDSGYAPETGAIHFGIIVTDEEGNACKPEDPIIINKG